ncbi:hypothetical protein VTL71DRAFT_13914 [Oculimacula yallundae]|uniref:2EXR domain-containing protein n=1 Tax=Oculimacula yallundae TaxID=86028 RepID=A0ABR4CLR9_9HELO
MFDLFPDLPLEIRLLIWETACYEARLLDIWYSGVDLEGLDDFSMGFKKPHYFYSHAPIPSILHTCQDARKIGLQHYQLDPGFGMEKKIKRTCGVEIAFTVPSRIYVNWECDIVCPNFDPENDYTSETWMLPSSNYLREFTHQFKHVQHLAIRADWLDSFDEPYFQDDFKWLTNLLPCSAKSVPLFKDFTIYDLPPETEYPFSSNNVSLRLVRLARVDDEASLPDEMEQLGVARETLSEALQYIGNLRALEKVTFVLPTISMAFLHVVDIESSV